MENQPRWTSSIHSTNYTRYVRWQTPQPGVIKLNFDGSYANSSAAGGFLLRDWMGKVIKAAAVNYGHTLSLVAEARAVEDGVLLALRAGYTEIAIEGDNLIVIQALNGEGHIPWQILNIIKDIQLLIQQDVQVSFTHIFREAKMAADWLSKFGHSITHTCITDFCFSPVLLKLLRLILLDALL